MSTSASGTVLDLDENGGGVEGLDVVLDDVSQLHPVTLAKNKTKSDGTFELTYADYVVTSEPGRQVRQLRLQMLLGQHVLNEVTQSDVSTENHLTFEPIRLPRAAADSWWALG